ncbi:MAG: Alpha-galactosidase [Chloroflexi bacterium]|nr:Alpha-galactosidase [Chloroflexota bacterium]
MRSERIVPGTTPQDMLKSRAWMGAFLSSAEQLPISFLYDGERIAGIPSSWIPVREERRIDANIVETVYEGSDVQTGLRMRVEILRYSDYPVVEWTAWLTNQGNTSTPIISDLRALDGAFEGRSPVLHHCNGDFASENGYMPQETSLHPGNTLTLAPTGGRACDGAFPYFRIAFEGCGMTIAIGWPGQWTASFSGGANDVSIQAGQEQTHLQLQPGERIRTPRMTILSWTGDQARAVNLWRRWYLAHVLPRPDGRPLQPLLTAAATDDGEEFTAASEENQIRYMDAFKQRGFDYDVWWIDAGWYPCYNGEGQRRWMLTGTWEPDAERFPRGFRPVSENATRNGASLLIWFEPERVSPNSWLFDAHPEWLWPSSGTGEGFAQWSSLLNLGNPECRQWLTDHYCTLIRDNGIKIYRQDFNFAPLQYWRDNEAENRQGMNENLHVQGYLQFWDDLLTRNPGLWIDSCASGGRRNDLETMRRAVPLHYSDHGYGNHPVKLAFHHTLYAWIPYFKESTTSWDLNGPDDSTRFDRQLDSFSFHCAMAPMLFLTLDIRRDDYDFALGRQMTAIWRRASTLQLNGDYYPLTPFSSSAERWVARQFDSPETGEGLIQGIRLAACAEGRLTVYPKALDPDSSYILANPETGESRQIPGRTLLSDGFTFELPRRSGAIWFYNR